MMMYKPYFLFTELKRKTSLLKAGDNCLQFTGPVPLTVHYILY